MPQLPAEKNYPIDEINNRLFFRLFQTANTLHTKGSQALEEFGVTTQQWSVLGALSRPKVTGGMSIGDLSRFLLMSRQNLAGLLSRLERDGLIERVVSDKDRRSRSVKLSAQGEVLWQKLQKPIHSFYGEALKNLSFDDRLAFIHYFTVLQGNMAKL
jgi:MarR family transcriptional regulator, organic hydroperoxide resistance regulator